MVLDPSPPQFPGRMIEYVTPKVTKNTMFVRSPRKELLNHFTGIFNIFLFPSSKSPHITVICTVPPFSDFHYYGSALGQPQVSCWKEPSLPTCDPAGLHLGLFPATWLSHLPGQVQGLPWPLLPFGLSSDAREVGGEDWGLSSWSGCLGYWVELCIFKVFIVSAVPIWGLWALCRYRESSSTEIWREEGRVWGG